MIKSWNALSWKRIRAQLLAPHRTIPTIPGSVVPVLREHRNVRSCCQFPVELPQPRPPSGKGTFSKLNPLSSLGFNLCFGAEMGCFMGMDPKWNWPHLQPGGSHAGMPGLRAPPATRAGNPWIPRLPAPAPLRNRHCRGVSCSIPWIPSQWETTREWREEKTGKIICEG